MEHQDIINELADSADELFSGRSREEAREAILEHLRENHPQFAPAERRQILDAVTRILDSEDFFTSTPGGDPTDSGDDDSSAEEE